MERASAARDLRPETSNPQTNPCRFHPTRSSQLRAAATGGGRSVPAHEPGLGPGFQPPNHAPEDAGSTPPVSLRPSAAACLLALSKTYAIARRTSRGVFSTRTWYRSARTEPSRRKTRCTARARRAPMDQPEVAPVAALRERTLDLADELCSPERRDTLSHLHGDMTREPRSDFASPTSVPNARLRSRLATGPAPSAAPARRLAQCEFELRCFL